MRCLRCRWEDRDAVARAFAREGANALAGRTLAPPSAVAAEITASGGAVETAEVDALVEEAVEGHASNVAGEAGSIDVSFNAISLGDVQGTPCSSRCRSRTSAVQSGSASTTHLLTARAAAHARAGIGCDPHALGFGVRIADPVMGPPMMGGASGVACAAIEALTMNLAGELGPRGIRVVCLRPEGIPET